MLRAYRQLIASLSVIPPALLAHADAAQPAVEHRTATVDGLSIFYREAGPGDAPTIVLLHGFPTSSFMYRDLLPQLASRYHVIASTILSSPWDGAHAYLRDIPDAELRLLDAGHFALETHSREIAELILDFMKRRVAAAR